MRIVNTFISDGGPFPSYIETSLVQARRKNPHVPIDFICKERQLFFSAYGINWIPQDGLSDGDLLGQFNQVCDFKRHGTPNTTHPSPEMFWHRTAERIFYVLEYITRNNHEKVFHFENDVLLYHPISRAEVNGKTVNVTPMSATHTTFAVTYVPAPGMLADLCERFIYYLECGEDSIRAAGGYDHVSEMSLLNLALREGLVHPLPTISTEGEFVYDPGSYGQYFGGTNNGHGKGFTDPTHFIGHAINSKMVFPAFMVDGPINGDHSIFNLHIHSKNLKDFAR